MYNRDVNKEIYYKVLSMVCMYNLHSSTYNRNVNNKIFHMVLPIKDSCTYKIYSFIQCTCRKDKITVFSSTLWVHTSNNRFELKGHGHLMCAPKSSLGMNYILDLINLIRGGSMPARSPQPKLISFNV